MKYGIIKPQTLENIASAIRTLTGTREELKPREMVTKLREKVTSKDTEVAELISGTLKYFKSSTIREITNPWFLFYCTELETIDVENINYIDSNNFINRAVNASVDLVLRDNKVFYPNQKDYVTVISGKLNAVYVPRAVLSQYKSDTGWKQISSKIYALEGSKYE